MNKTKPFDNAAAAAAATGTIPAAAPPLQDDRPMTEIQAAELRQLAETANEPFDGNLTEQQAEERLEYLRAKV